LGGREQGTDPGAWGGLPGWGQRGVGTNTEGDSRGAHEEVPVCWKVMNRGRQDREKKGEKGR